MITFLGILASIAGIISFVILMQKEYFPYRKLSWKFAERKSQEIADQLVKEDFSPTLIVGIGRGGAIFGAMISGCLGHRPLLVIDREYKWKKSGRTEDILFPIVVPQSFLKRVLLVAGEIHSGGTMRVYENYFYNMGAKEIKKAVLLFEEGCPVRVEYIGFKTERKNILLPWMFSKNYIRADRHPPRNY